MDWLEVTVAAAPGEAAEAASLALFAAGASGIEEASVLADERVRLTAYLPAAALPLDALPLARCGAAVLSARAVRDRDWEAEWRASLAPLEVGRRLAVVPTTCGAPPAGRLAIRLDPGIGFGTGTHPTTSLSLEALEEVLDARAGRPSALLDVGTGSGILAIAARLLGAAPVVAIDTDPLAVEEARRNLERNGCAGAVEASTTPLAALERTFDVVVANLDAPTLKLVHDDLAARLAVGGTLVVSGLRERESWPAPRGIEREREVAKDGWRAEVWRRRG
jgi:ribosomal protein L11 methyltransferase